MTSTISYKVYSVDSLTNSLGTLTQWHHEQSTEVLNDVGRGSIQIQNDDAQLSLLTVGRVVRKFVDSTAAFQWVIDRMERQSLDLSEEVNHLTTISGDGIGQIMGRAVVQPTLGYGRTPWGPSRSFSFASQQFSPDGTWTHATELNLQSVQSTYYTGLPTGWPDPNAAWITTSVDTSTAGHVGSWYVIGDHTFSSDTEIVLFMAADNKADVYLDGFALTTFGTQVGFNETHRATAFVTAGQHRIAAKISNYVDGATTDPGLGMGTLLGGNPTSFLCSCYEVGSNGQLGKLAIHTDNEWSILEYPSTAPGMTPGQVMGILISEEQTDGLIPQISQTFTNTYDTAAVTWSTYETITLPVGETLVNVLREFAGAYCDWSVSSGDTTTNKAQLSMWALGTKGTTKSVTYTPGVNLTSLKHDKVDAGTDALLVSWSGGQFRYPSSGGNRIAPFSAGNARTRAEATTLAAQQLALLGGTRTEYAATIECASTTDQPYTGYVTGDRVTVPDETGTNSTQRVMQIVGTTDEEGNPIWSPTFRDIHLDVNARLALNVNRMASGTLGGYSTVATPAGTPPPFGSTLNISEITFSCPDPVVTGEASKNKVPSQSGNLYAVAVTAKNASSSTTTFQYLVDGADVLNGNGALYTGSTFNLINVDMGSSQFTKWIEGNKSVLTVNITGVGATTKPTGLVFEGRVL